MIEMERKPKVTLEDLLQVKRTERPSAEFWTQFEQELRTKQLAALVQTRPWWRSLTARKVWVRLYAPLGAAAVVALTFGSYRGSVARTGTSSNAVVALQAPVVSSASATTLQQNEIRSTPLNVSETAVAQTSLVQSNESENQTGSELAQTSYDNNAKDSAEQVLASSAATVKAAGQAFAQLVGLIDGQPVKENISKPQITEPLAQVATPRDNRRARLLAYSVVYDPHALGSTDAARSREQITRRISDQSIYDSITRLGVSGDRVSIKF
jgi:hypothetical protein